MRSIFLTALVALILTACGGTTVPAASEFDRQFVDDMIAHHQSAVRDSQAALPTLARPEVKALAAAIASAQQAEIAQLQSWRQAWFASAPVMTALPMTGDMAMTAPIMTGDSDHDFMVMMIPHHQDAVRMAQAALKNSQRPELLKLAQNIVKTQTAEIAQMQGWLK